jgi:hypothetical protein
MLLTIENPIGAPLVAGQEYIAVMVFDRPNGRKQTVYVWFPDRSALARLTSGVDCVG